MANESKRIKNSRRDVGYWKKSLARLKLKQSRKSNN